ncbi:MAG: hypothetical protein JXR95_02695 [Deltaproteobacteria bacterium]|nr:hypothetical protein [Deltaproteobacteria bacterium]
MSEEQIIIMVLSTGGAILSLPRFFRVVFILSINTRVFHSVIMKLIKSDNADRALKLCSVAPNSLYPMGVSAALKGVLRGENQPEEIRRNFNSVFTGSDYINDIYKYRMVGVAGFFLVVGALYYSFSILKLPVDKHLIPAGIYLGIHLINAFKSTKLRIEMNSYLEILVKELSDEKLSINKQTRKKSGKESSEKAVERIFEDRQDEIPNGTENNVDGSVITDSEAAVTAHEISSGKGIYCKNCSRRLEVSDELLSEINSDYDVFSKIDASCAHCNGSLFELKK